MKSKVLKFKTASGIAKTVLMFCLTLFVFTSAQSQVQDPVKWMAAYKPASATEGEVIITAIIDKGWHIYSQDSTSEGPIPTSFSFAANKNYQLLGKAEEIGAHKIFDKAFDTTVSSFSEKGEFRQKIKITGKPGFTLAFKVEYMCCDDNMCLPPKTVDVNVKVQ